MNASLIAMALSLVAVSGTVVALTTRPSHQAVTLSVFGLLLSVLFVVLQAPDVALSQIGVGTALVPLMVMLAVRSIRRDRAGRGDADGDPAHRDSTRRDSARGGATGRDRR